MTETMTDQTAVQILPSEEGMLWKRKDDSLVPISSLTDEELFAARRTSASKVSDVAKEMEKLKARLVKSNNMYDLFTDMLALLDSELTSRKAEIQAKKDRYEYELNNV